MKMTRKTVLGIAIALVIIYALISGAGLFVFSGRLRLREVPLFVAPVLTVFIAILSLFKVRPACFLMWIGFATIHLGYLIIDWPHPDNLWIALTFDWPVLLASVLLTWVALADKKLSGDAAVG
jgi:hypothetical protein